MTSPSPTRRGAAKIAPTPRQTWRLHGALAAERWLSLVAPRTQRGGAGAAPGRRAGPAFQAANRQQGRPVLSLITDDGVTEAKRLKAKGVGFVKEPYRRDYGGIDAVFADSCGNLAQPAPGLTGVVMQPTCGPNRNWLCGADAWSGAAPLGIERAFLDQRTVPGASLERPRTPVERPIGNSRSHRWQGREGGPVMAPSTEGPTHNRILYRLTWRGAVAGPPPGSPDPRQRGRLAADREGQRLRRPPSRHIHHRPGTSLGRSWSSR
jgi:hypothetical protein